MLTTSTRLPASFLAFTHSKAGLDVVCARWAVLLEYLYSMESHARSNAINVGPVSECRSDGSRHVSPMPGEITRLALAGYVHVGDRQVAVRPGARIENGNVNSVPRSRSDAHLGIDSC